MADYFVITATEDGDVFVAKMTKAELEKQYNEEWWGNLQNDLILINKNRGIDLREKSGLVIIKGEQVVPKAVKSVTRYEVD